MVFVLRGIALPSEITVRASVDRRVVTLEDEITLTLEVTGADSVSIQTLNLPDGIAEGGRSTSRNIQIVNGRMSSNLSYNFTLIPERSGKFKIGPIKVEHGGKIYESNSIEVEIGGQSINESVAKGEKDFYLKQWVDKERAFVNEKILYTIEFGRRVNIADASFSSFPKLAEFLIEEIEKGAEETRIINGVKYSIFKIKKAIFPAKSGLFTIESPMLSFFTFESSRRRSIFDDFGFGGLMGERKRRTLKANPININVLSIPEEGKPISFTGLVGTFDIKAELSAKEVKRGDSLTLTIDIFGEGNIKGIKTPLLPTLPDFKIYDDKPLLEEKVIGDKIIGKQSFKKALIPLSEGEFTLSPILISYFDPHLKKYVVKESEAKKIIVLPGDSENLNSVASPFASSKKEVEILGKDILPIHNRVKLFSRDSSISPILVSLLFLPPLGFVAIFLYRKKRILISQDANFEARKNAYKRALLMLNNLKRGEEDIHGEGAKLLKIFVGNKLGFPGAALTPHDINSKLREVGIDEAVANRTSSFLEECEYKLYCGTHETEDERKELIKKISLNLKGLNKILTK